LLDHAVVELTSHLVAHTAGGVDNEGDVGGFCWQADGGEVFVLEALEEAVGLGGGLLGGAEVGLAAVEFLLEIGELRLELLNEG